MRPLYQLPIFPNYRANRVAFEGRCIYLTLDDWVEAYGYILGWCLRRHRLELYAFCLMFNHGHYDLGHPTEDDAEVEPRFSAFFEDLHRHYYWLLRRAGGWSHGPAFTRLERTHQRPSLDGDQIWHDLCYDTAQAVAAGFFKHSRHYNGLCFQPENVTTPRVFRRNSLIAKLDPDRQLFTDDQISVQLSIPRPFKHLSPTDYQSQFRTRLDAHEASIASPRTHHPDKARRICNATPLGAPLRPDRLQRPTKKHPPKPPGPPPANSTCSTLRQLFRTARAEFWAKHKRALELVRQGAAQVLFPAGTYAWRKRLNAGVEPLGPSFLDALPVWKPD